MQAASFLPMRAGEIDTVGAIGRLPLRRMQADTLESDIECFGRRRCDICAGKHNPAARAGLIGCMLGAFIWTLPFTYRIAWEHPVIAIGLAAIVTIVLKMRTAKSETEMASSIF